MTNRTIDFAMRRLWNVITVWGLGAWVAWATPTVVAQDQSVRPGINESFQNPDAKAYTERFETESREVYAHRQAIVDAVDLKPGQHIADIGAGTGLFTRLFANKVGPGGRVFAVDIAKNFLDHIAARARSAGHPQIQTVRALEDSVELPESSVDVAFICDTYHHFEYPLRTMASLHSALRPGGRLVVIDFHRIEGVSSDWTLGHVRAGQEVFESEIVRSGFRKLSEIKGLLEDNYFLVFEKIEKTMSSDQSSKETTDGLEYPIIKGFGGVVLRPGAVEPPRAGTKVVFDITAGTGPGQINKGLDRAARLLNLYGAHALVASDVSVTVVLHGAATASALSDDAIRSRTNQTENRDLALVAKLRQAGVRVVVCGQSLAELGYTDAEVAKEVTIAVSAMTAIINEQAEGASYLPIR